MENVAYNITWIMQNSTPTGLHPDRLNTKDLLLLKNRVNFADTISGEFQVRYKGKDRQQLFTESDCSQAKLCFFSLNHI